MRTVASAAVLFEENMEKLTIWSNRIGCVCAPLAVYYGLVIVAMLGAQTALGTGEEQYMLCQIFSGFVVLPVMYLVFYRKDRQGAPDVYGGYVYRYEPLERKSRGAKNTVADLVCFVAIAACVGIALNNLISMSPLVEISEGYAEANRYFYGSTLVLELIGSALLTPLLEELVYRGILYGRLRRMAGTVPGILVSSLIFALMHFNLVQFVYAFCLGIVLALFMERCGHVYGAVLGHITANFIAVLRTETGVLAVTMDGSAFAWGISVGLLLAGVGLLSVRCRHVLA